MSQRIKLVQNDTKPSIYVVLEDQAGNPLDLTGATVRMHFRATGSTTLKATVAGTLLPGLVAADGTVDTASPYHVAGSGGYLRLDWGATDLDTAGEFEGEVQATFADTTKQTTYRTLKFTVRSEMA